MIKNKIKEISLNIILFVIGFACILGALKIADKKCTKYEMQGGSYSDCMM